MKEENRANTRMLAKLMFSLLPVQVLLAAVDSLDCFISSFFASNYIGVEAMSAIGLYSPLNMLITALALLISGGSSILCGKYLGRNEHDKLQNIFMLNIFITASVSLAMFILFVGGSIFDLTKVLCADEQIRPLFNSYLLTLSFGVFPNILTNQLPVFLAVENRNERTFISSIIYIIANVFLNFFLIIVLKMGVLGLGLASSLGNLIFMAVQLQYFFTKDAALRIVLRKPDLKDAKDIFVIGLPGAASNAYQTVRGLIVNSLIGAYVGSVGISAFATTDNFLRLFWAVPIGMLSVSRLLISVCIGEEDRQSLADVMRVVIRYYVPAMFVICFVLVFSADTVTQLFYHDPSEPVYQMTVQGFRIMTFCLPFSIICNHFVCYAQASNKPFLVNLLSILDGVAGVLIFTIPLIGTYGLNSVYLANVLSSILTCVVIVIYAWLQKAHLPKDMDELMVIPDDFGAPADQRLDLSIRNIEDVVKVSQLVQDFCKEQGIDSRRAYLAGLSMEEMAGNVVEHGFNKDRRSHTVDVRVVKKEDDVILRIKDDCKPFDPNERKKMDDDADPAKNMGIKMVYKIAKDVQYQYVLGLNVLTIRI